MSGARRLLLALAGLALAGCAQLPQRPADAPFWQGRLALRIESAPPQLFSADFDLSGNAEAGELLLSGPLGQRVAQLRWSPGRAIWQGNGETRTFDTLDALSTQLSGTPLPLAALFEWLAGREAAADGWQADLTQLTEGRLTARRLQPEPVAELKLIIEPSSR